MKFPVKIGTTFHPRKTPHMLPREVRPISALAKNSLWWKGPTFLTSRDSWPKNTSIFETDLEQRKNSIFHSLKNSAFESIIDFERFSNFSRLQRTFAYVYRFIDNLRSKTKNFEPLSSSELKRALFNLAKIAQNQDFAPEISNLGTACHFLQNLDF